MKNKIKDMWIDNLINGNYEQGKDCLKDEDKYCCLGVLCDLYIKEHNLSWNSDPIKNRKYSIFNCVSTLPVEVADWAGISRENNLSPFMEGVDPKVSINLEDITLAELNDKGDENSTFENIAKIIQEQL